MYLFTKGWTGIPIKISQLGYYLSTFLNSRDDFWCGIFAISNDPTTRFGTKTGFETK